VPVARIDSRTAQPPEAINAGLLVVLNAGDPAEVSSWVAVWLAVSSKRWTAGRVVG